MTRPNALYPPALSPIPLRQFFASAFNHVGDGKSGLRDEMCKYFDADDIRTFTNFRRAIISVLKETKQRDQTDRKTVVVPRYSCDAFEFSIEMVDLNVLFVDLNPETLALNSDTLDCVDTDDVLAMIAVNHFGLSNPMESLVDFCSSNDIVLIEDLGYSLGAEYDNQPLGTFGDYAVVNFKEGKAIPVGGGVAVSRRGPLRSASTGVGSSRPNPHLLLAYKLVANPHLYGLYKQFVDYFDHISAQPGSDDDIDPDTAFRTLPVFQTELAAQILQDLPDYRSTRNAHARRYREMLVGTPGIELFDPVPDLTTPHFIRYPILVEPAVRQRIHDRLLEAGIEAPMMYNRDTKVRPIDETRYPGSAYIQKRIIVLPTHHKISQEHVERTVAIINSELQRANT